MEFPNIFFQWRKAEIRNTGGSTVLLNVFYHRAAHHHRAAIPPSIAIIIDYDRNTTTLRKNVL
jgi:hypothetical protein